MSSFSRVIRSRWVVPVAEPPIENGYVALRGDLITQVGRGRPPGADEVIDAGDAILLPGLTNAHTHLALTALHNRVPFGGEFAGWIRTLASETRVLEADAVFQNSVAAGLQASLQAGVTRVADIGYGQRSVDAWSGAPLHLYGFLEVLGMGHRRWGGHERCVGQAAPMVHRAREAKHPATLGLSPHAPYSTDRIVFLDALRTGLRLCIHVAETREEHQFLRDGSGPFRDLLEAWNLWDGSFSPPGCSPVAYLYELRVLQEGMPPSCAPLLAHVNYTSDEDLEILARCNAHVVYCPRTHAFFRHEPHRYRDMLARGINVCIGTDSLAINESLSVLDELRFLRAMDHESSDAALLLMATVHADRALGQSGSFGRIAPGYAADLLVVPLEHVAAPDPVEDLLRGTRLPTHVIVDGEVRWQAQG